MNVIMKPDVYEKLWACLRADFDDTVTLYVQQDGWGFQTFAKVARKKHLTSVYHWVSVPQGRRVEHKREQHASQVLKLIIKTAKETWLNPFCKTKSQADELANAATPNEMEPEWVGIKKRLGGLFLLWLIHQTQPLPRERFYRIELNFEDCNELEQFENELRNSPLKLKGRGISGLRLQTQMIITAWKLTGMLDVMASCEWYGADECQNYLRTRVKIQRLGEVEVVSKPSIYRDKIILHKELRNYIIPLKTKYDELAEWYNKMRTDYEKRRIRKESEVSEALLSRISKEMGDLASLLSNSVTPLDQKSQNAYVTSDSKKSASSRAQSSNATNTGPSDMDIDVDICESLFHDLEDLEELPDAVNATVVSGVGAIDKPVERLGKNDLTFLIDSNFQHTETYSIFNPLQLHESEVDLVDLTDNFAPPVLIRKGVPIENNEFQVQGFESQVDYVNLTNDGKTFGPPFLLRKGVLPNPSDIAVEETEGVIIEELKPSEPVTSISKCTTRAIKNLKLESDKISDLQKHSPSSTGKYDFLNKQEQLEQTAKTSTMNFEKGKTDIPSSSRLAQKPSPLGIGESGRIQTSFWAKMTTNEKRAFAKKIKDDIEKQMEIKKAVDAFNELFKEMANPSSCVDELLSFSTKKVQEKRARLRQIQKPRKSRAKPKPNFEFSDQPESLDVLFDALKIEGKLREECVEEFNEFHANGVELGSPFERHKIGFGKYMEMKPTTSAKAIQTLPLNASTANETEITPIPQLKVPKKSKLSKKEIQKVDKFSMSLELGDPRLAPFNATQPFPKLPD